MAKICTLRNIITLFVLLFLVSCNKDDINNEVQSISSEDKYSSMTKIGEIKDAESGQTFYVVTKK